MKCLTIIAILLSYYSSLAKEPGLKTFTHSLGYEIKYSPDKWKPIVDVCCDHQELNDALAVNFMKAPEFNEMEFQIASIISYSKEYPNVKDPLEYMYSRSHRHSNSVLFKKDSIDSTKRIINVLEVGGYKDKVRWEITYFCPGRGFAILFMQKFTKIVSDNSKIPAPKDLKIPYDIQKVLDTFRCTATSPKQK